MLTRNDIRVLQALEKNFSDASKLGLLPSAMQSNKAMILTALSEAIDTCKKALVYGGINTLVDTAKAYTDTNLFTADGDNNVSAPKN